MPNGLDRTDKALLNALQGNARLTVAELADQVAESFAKYAKGTKLSWVLLIGGVSMGDQVAALNKGVDVLIATPGRLLDHRERGKLLLARGLPVSEVALAVGFFDQSHFHHGFRQAFGLTPAEFRAQMQSFTSRAPR